MYYLFLVGVSGMWNYYLNTVRCCAELSNADPVQNGWRTKHQVSHPSLPSLCSQTGQDLWATMWKWGEARTTLWKIEDQTNKRTAGNGGGVGQEASK